MNISMKNLKMEVMFIQEKVSKKRSPLKSRRKFSHLEE
jgi:hypothetical protein